MSIEFLDEVTNLESVSTRVEEHADAHPTAAEALIAIAAQIRSIAALLALLVTTKLQKIQ
jgi:hypothetical protein